MPSTQDNLSHKQGENEQSLSRAIALAQKGRDGAGGAFAALVVRNSIIIAAMYTTVKQRQDITKNAVVLGYPIIKTQFLGTP